MKQMKILGVLAIAATLGLTACGGGGGKKSSSKHTHKWGEYVTIKEATCTEPGTQERECSECHEKQTKSIPAAHKWGEWETVTAPTCTEAGSRKHVCSVCQQEESETVDATGHTWGEWEVVSAADCTNAGSRKHTCSVCHVEESETIPATGHTWGDWVDVQAPTCTEKGSHKHTCSVCNVEESEEVAALGHHLVLQADDGTAAKEDFAKVRVYECDRDGCDYATFGFKATETSQNSGRLVEETVTNDKGEEEIGKRFWGRPIGNDVALDENGTADRENHEPVYNPETQGDLFEYKFTLTEAQVQALGSDIACYADAKPADYLNNKDFWAADSGEEWTPGFYIEGDKAGTQITDYRYILYVDGSPVQFDESIKAPVPNGSSTNIARGEFIMPYIFHFAAGDHSISLRMAGGYRSLFFNFIFKSYETEEVPPEPPVEEDPWVLDETTVMPTPAADEATVLRYKNKTDAELVKYEIAAKTGNFQLTDDHSRWKTDPSSGAFKLDKFSSSYGGGEGCSFSFKFSLPAAFEGKMYQRSYMDSYKNNYTKKLYYQTNNHANIEVKFNGGDAIDLSQFAETTFQDVFGDGTGLDNSEVKDVEIGNVVLKASNTGTFKRVETLNMITSHFVFIGKDHAHNFVYGAEAVQKAGECDYVVGQCAADGAKALKIDASKDLNGKITKRGGKLPKGSSGKYDGTAIASYKFTAPAGFAAKAHLMAVGTVDNAGNYNYSFYTGKVGTSTQNPLEDGSTNTVLTINGKSVAMPTATYREMGCTGLDEAGAGLIDFGEFDVIEGTNEFTLAATNSYGIQYFDFIIAE